MINKLTPAALLALANGDLTNFSAATRPGGIEAQEAQGQKDFVAHQTLSIDCLEEPLRSQFEGLGFLFEDPVDDLFVAVSFPRGWSKRATAHSMWSDLLDDRGRKRASLFYKAAFYDRKAHTRLTTRYLPCTDFSAHPSTLNKYSIKDHDGTVLSEIGDAQDTDYPAQRAMEQKCLEEIMKRFPEWQDPLAYWD